MWSKKREEILRILCQCVHDIEGVEAKLDRVADTVSLTHSSVELHDRLEKHFRRLALLLNESKGKELDNIALSSIATVLPDAAVAAILWIPAREKQREFLSRIKTGLGKMRVKLDQFKSEDKFTDEFTSCSRALHKLVEDLRKSVAQKRNTKSSCCDTKESEALLRTRDFLSQQIDERSHQIWTLGSLFVPVSFLIFAYAMTVYAVVGQGAVFLLFSSTGKILLMCASLGCYSVWFLFYVRANQLNKLSYPLIHSLELILGIHGHLSLDMFRLPSRLLRMTWPRFLAALYVLATLWILLLRSSVGISSIAVSMFLSFYVSTWVSLKIDILKNIKRIAASILVYAALVGGALLLLPVVITTLFPNLDPALL